MCANYLAYFDLGGLEDEFGATGEGGVGEGGDTWPMGLGPFIRLSESGKRIVESGHFGLLPHFAKEIAYGRKTYNARSETIAQLASFKESWEKSRRCIIPAELIYEPKYDMFGANPVRWRISFPEGKPMAIAGLYRVWRDPMGLPRNTFTMITVNADSHPVMSQFHKPGEEKRMVLMLTKEQYDGWLTCSPDEAKGFFQQYQGELVTAPAPLPPRKKKDPAEAKAPRAKKQPPAAPPIEDPGLF